MIDARLLYNSIENEVRCRIYSFSNMNIETSRQAAISATRRRVASVTSVYLRCSSHTGALTIHLDSEQDSGTGQDRLIDCIGSFRDPHILSDRLGGHTLVASTASHEKYRSLEGG